MPSHQRPVGYVTRRFGRKVNLRREDLVVMPTATLQYSANAKFTASQRIMHHSDRDVPYRAIRYTEWFGDCDAVASTGSRSDSYDNAMAEASKLSLQG